MNFEHIWVVIGTFAALTGCLGKKQVAVQPEAYQTVEPANEPESGPVTFPKDYKGKALTETPVTWKDYYDGGTWLFRRGKYGLAEKYFLKAKNASAAWYGLMKLYVLQGKFKDAKKWLTKLRSEKGVNQQELDLFEKAINDQKLSNDFRRMIEPPKPTTKSSLFLGVVMRLEIS